MTLAITHSTVTGAAADTTALVDGPKWDAAHTLTGAASPSQGGTGVANNDASTVTISGSFGLTFTISAATSLTFPTTGTVATLAGTEELDNKTLDASVAKGTWTASGTWTLPAHTLGGTVSGGGNQINNVIIGASTPLAGTFTTVDAPTHSIAAVTFARRNANYTELWQGTGAAAIFLGDSSTGYANFYRADAHTLGDRAGSFAWLLVNSTGIAAIGSIKTSSATAGVGYATGAGGTVTQITSKATGVTLSKSCGAITMNNAALAADTTVSFVLTNTAIAATDVLVLNHISGGAVGSYLLNAQAAAGSATINVRNITAGSLSDAVVIQFAVVKAVNA